MARSGPAPCPWLLFLRRRLREFGFQLTSCAFSWAVLLAFCTFCCAGANPLLGGNAACPFSKHSATAEDGTTSFFRELGSSSFAVSESFGRTTQQKGPPPGGTDFLHYAPRSIPMVLQGIGHKIEGLAGGCSMVDVAECQPLFMDKAMLRFFPEVMEASECSTEVLNCVQCASYQTLLEIGSLDKEIQFQAILLRDMNGTITPTNLGTSRSLFSASKMVNLVSSSSLNVSTSSSSFAQISKSGFRGVGSVMIIPIVSMSTILSKTKGIKAFHKGQMHLLSSASVSEHFGKLLSLYEDMETLNEQSSGYQTHDPAVKFRVQKFGYDSCVSASFSGSCQSLCSLVKGKPSTFENWTTPFVSENYRYSLFCGVCKYASEVPFPSERKPRAVWQTSSTHRHAGSLDLHLQEGRKDDCSMAMVAHISQSNVIDECVKMKLILSQEHRKGSSCRWWEVSSKAATTSSLSSTAGLPGQLMAPFHEPPIFPKLFLKLFLIAFFLKIVLRMRVVRQESLPPVVEGKSWHLCNYTFIFQSSLKIGCMKTCLLSRPFDHSFQGVDSGSRDWGTQNVEEPWKWKVYGVVLKFAGHIFHFLRLVDPQFTISNFRVQVTHNLSNVNGELVNEDYNNMQKSVRRPGGCKAGFTLPLNSTFEPLSPPAYKTRPEKASLRATMTNGIHTNDSSCKQDMEGHMLPLMVPRVFIPTNVSLSNDSLETESPSSEKGVQSSVNKEGFSLKERDKAKRRKRRSNINSLKHEADKGGQSGSSSPPSSPASPATPLSSTRASPFLRSDCILPTCSSGGGKRPVTPKSLEPSSRTLSQLDAVGNISKNKSLLFSRNNLLHGLELKAHVDSVPVKAPAAINLSETSCGCVMQGSMTQDRSSKSFLAENWATVARRAMASCEVAPFQGQSGRTKIKEKGEDLVRKPVLLPSATFPQAGQRSSRCRPSQGRIALFDEPLSGASLISSSLVSPDARAPGSSRPSKQRDGESLRKSTEPNNCELVYDIWGNHFAEIARVGIPEQTTTLFQDKIAFKEDPSQLYHHQSFFAKPGFLVSDSPPYASFSVFSTNTIFSSPSEEAI